MLAIIIVIVINSMAKRSIRVLAFIINLGVSEEELSDTNFAKEV